MTSYDNGDENIFLLHTHSKLFLMNILVVNNVVYFKTKSGYICVCILNFYVTLDSRQHVRISVVMCYDAN
jgi:hypothetical protein